MISVVIPAHNAARTLGDCLQAICSSDYAAYEVIVVDDASTDATAQLAAQYGCRVVRLPQNVGAAQAKNVGVQSAKGEIVLFTDADVVLQSDTLRLVAEDLTDPGIAGVVGLLGKKLRYGNFSSQFKNLWMYYTYTRLAVSEEASRGVGLFFTSLAAIRKEIFLRVGGFDVNYRGASITEDIEFGQRLLSVGLRVRLDGRLQVEHLKHYDWRGLLRTDLQRALGLSKTWLRRKLEPEQRSSGQRYYASVPWFFVLGVPPAWLLLPFALLALWTRQPGWALATLLDYLSILLVNLPFLNALREARGWLFGVQCCLFLPLDLWVSGLGVLWAGIDYVAGDRY
jgi:glycosyltransferase involved in cell wall biosynthesis